MSWKKPACRWAKGWLTFLRPSAPLRKREFVITTSRTKRWTHPSRYRKASAISPAFVRNRLRHEKTNSTHFCDLGGLDAGFACAEWHQGNAACLRRHLQLSPRPRGQQRPGRGYLSFRSECNNRRTYAARTLQERLESCLAGFRPLSHAPVLCERNAELSRRGIRLCQRVRG